MAENFPRVNIRLSGSGGQGIALAATVLAEAALECALYATLIQEHGPEARGGATRADVSIAGAEIPNPQFSTPDLCLVLSDKAWDRFGKKLVGRAGVGLIVDRDTVDLSGLEESERQNIIALGFEETAKVKVGAKVVTNMVCAAALVRLIEAVSLESLEAAAAKRSPAAFREKNLAAVKLGWRLADDYLASHSLNWRILDSHSALSGGTGGSLAKAAGRGAG